MHIKYSSPYDWNAFGHDCVRPIKISSKGLVGTDRQALKKVASEEFIWKLDRHEVKPDEYPVHMVGTGDDETVGGNRNGDTFSSETNRKQAYTFAEAAKPFRNHKHFPEKGHPHFGKIAMATYNPNPGRTELLVLYNATKSACERNGGLVADEEISDCERGIPLKVSMACLVPKDVCSWCKNAAANRSEYCTSATCEAGGCRDNLGKYVKVAGDAHHLRVFNPNCRFFDISKVGLNAEMTAFGTKADYLSKTAGAFDFFSLRDELAKAAASPLPPMAPLLCPGDPTVPLCPVAQTLLKFACELAAVEQFGPIPAAAEIGFNRTGVDAVTKLASYESDFGRAQVRDLAERGIILSFEQFAAWTKRADKAAEVAGVLPTLFTYFINDESGAQSLTDRRWMLESNGLKVAAAPHVVAALMGSSYDPSQVVERARTKMLAVDYVPTQNVKTASMRPASLNPVARRLALDYAAYKLAAVGALVESLPESCDSVFTAACAIGQNRS